MPIGRTHADQVKVIKKNKKKKGKQEFSSGSEDESDRLFKENQKKLKIEEEKLKRDILSKRKK